MKIRTRHRMHNRPKKQQDKQRGIRPNQEGYGLSLCWMHQERNSFLNDVRTYGHESMNSKDKSKEIKMNEEERTVASRRFAERLREMDSKRLNLKKSTKRDIWTVVLIVSALIYFASLFWVICL